jgi:hypothetical protein
MIKVLRMQRTVQPQVMTSSGLFPFVSSFVLNFTPKLQGCRVFETYRQLFLPVAESQRSIIAAS